ncbi:recombinase family protein [Oceanobacillus rekensis]|uniref:recombinase family protein n=1 Tax=Oceanobacillus rekensis TaxID=937927 RepID=UPI001593A273|nr:recombinase family protein [Oceanobacillus rekensis]
MINGYTRPLYNDKNLENQLKNLANNCDKIYQEKHGTPKKRTQLESLLMDVQPGDTIMVERLIVLADTSRHLIDLLKVCEKDNVKIHFLNEGINSDELLNITLLNTMEHIIQFQSDMIKQSTTNGMEEAKNQGKTIGRPKKSDDNIKKAMSMYHNGFKLLDIKNETGISKSTLYRYLESTEK